MYYLVKHNIENGIIKFKIIDSSEDLNMLGKYMYVDTDLEIIDKLKSGLDSLGGIIDLKMDYKLINTDYKQTRESPRDERLEAFKLKIREAVLNKILE